MHAKKIVIILEAAGDSKRFGSNKLLHPMNDGRPMIKHIFDTVRALPYKVVLVTQYDEIASMAPDFTVAKNDRPDLGISRSMQIGLDAAGEADGYMFCVCDQPALSSSSISNLVDAFCNNDAGIVSLAWNGNMCNPKIFSAKYKEELLQLSGDIGGRQIINNHKDDLLLVEAISEDEVKDIDTNEALELQR